MTTDDDMNLRTAEEDAQRAVNERDGVIKATTDSSSTNYDSSLPREMPGLASASSGDSSSSNSMSPTDQGDTPDFTSWIPSAVVENAPTCTNSLSEGISNTAADTPTMKEDPHCDDNNDSSTKLGSNQNGPPEAIFVPKEMQQTGGHALMTSDNGPQRHKVVPSTSQKVVHQTNYTMTSAVGQGYPDAVGAQQVLADTQAENNQVRHDFQEPFYNDHKCSPQSKHQKQEDKKPKKAGKTEAKTKAPTNISTTRKPKAKSNSLLKILLEWIGFYNVFLGRNGGARARDVPGNVYYRASIDKYYLQYRNGSKEEKNQILHRIYEEITATRCRFYIVTGKEVNGKPEIVEATVEEVLVKVKTAMRPSDRFKRMAGCWQWLESSNDGTGKSKEWTSFDQSDGENIERMYQRNAQDREYIEVTSGDRERRVVDLNELKMQRVGSQSWDFDVQRKEPNLETLEQKVIKERNDHDEKHNRSTGGGKSSPSGPSDSNSPRDSTNSLSSQGSPEARYPYSSKQHGLADAASRQTLTVIEATDVIVREATQEEIYDAIAMALEESWKNKKTTDSIATKSPTNLVACTESPSPDGVNLSSSTETATSTPRTSNHIRGSVEKSPTDTKDMSKIQPGVGMVHHIHISKTNDTVVWILRENRSRMAKHDATTVYGDAKDCWIRYDANTTKELEQAYQLQGGVGLYKFPAIYEVDFATMRQTNTLSGYQREVQRIVLKELTMPTMTKTSHSVKMGAGRIIDVKTSGVDTTLVKKMTYVRLDDDDDDKTTTLPMTTTSDSVKRLTIPILEDETSGLDALTKNMADGYLHGEKEKATISFTPSTKQNAWADDDLESAK